MAGEARSIERDGVKLAFQAAGEGDPTLVFVHPWCGDSEFFTSQLEHFGRKARCIAVDLRGHGRSDAPATTYSIAGFADDVAWMCSQLEVERAVVIGNSMGANVAVELAASHERLVSGLVLLDAVPVTPDAGLMRLLEQFLDQLRGPSSVDAQRQYCEGFLFLPGDDSARKRWIVDRMCATDRSVAAEAFAGSISWDGEAAARRLTVPVTVLAASDLQAPNEDIIRALLPHASIHAVPRVGHFMQLEDPDAVNGHIEQFLRTLVPVQRAE